MATSFYLIADAHSASRKVALPLLEQGHHLVSRLGSKATAYEPAAPSAARRRGRPKCYGRKIKLRDLFPRDEGFVTAASPVYGEQGVALRYRCLDLRGASVSVQSRKNSDSRFRGWARRFALRARANGQFVAGGESATARNAAGPSQLGATH